MYGKTKVNCMCGPAHDLFPLISSESACQNDWLVRPVETYTPSRQSYCGPRELSSGALNSLFTAQPASRWHEKSPRRPTQRRQRMHQDGLVATTSDDDQRTLRSDSDDLASCVCTVCVHLAWPVGDRTPTHYFTTLWSREQSCPASLST
jgi:hypothetical protein